MREIRTSGSVRDGGGNVPIYSALDAARGRQMVCEGVAVGQCGEVVEKGEFAGGVGSAEAFEE